MTERSRPASPPSHTGNLSLDLPTSALGKDRRQTIHICPMGIVRTRDGRGPYRLDDAEAVIKASQEHSGKAKMLVDYDHQSFTLGKFGGRAEAAGWIVGMLARPDGIWALVEWTEKAAAHIAAHEFRYLSPVISHLPNGAITRIENVALTNSPNLHEMTALSHKETLAMDPKIPASPDASKYADTTDATEDQMNKIRQLLKLAPDADAQAVIEAIMALVSTAQSAAPDPSKFVPIGLFERAVKDANDFRVGVSETQARDYVESKVASGQLAPHYRDWAIGLCTKNKPDFDAFMEKTGPAFRKLFEQQVPSGAPPFHSSAHRAGHDEGVESDVRERLGLSREEFNAARAPERD
jgi:phage I-like protein